MNKKVPNFIARNMEEVRKFTSFTVSASSVIVNSPESNVLCEYLYEGKISRTNHQGLTLRCQNFVNLDCQC